MHTQHHTERIRGTPHFTFWVMLSGAILQALPRNNGIHFFQENLTTRLTLFVLVFCFGKSQLAHDSAHWAKKRSMRLLSQKVGSYSEAPYVISRLHLRL